MSTEPKSPPQSPAKPPRPLPQSYIQLRSARTLIHDCQSRLAEWQHHVARLRAGLLVRGQSVAAIRSEAAELVAPVVAARIHFEQQLEEADPALAGHSLVHDVRQALLRLQSQIEDLAAGRLPEVADTLLEAAFAGQAREPRHPGAGAVLPPPPPTPSVARRRGCP